jgi:Fe-S oxidoreductase
LPDWTPSAVGRETKITFHLGRTMHLAGRCVSCGGCKAVCPSGVDVKYLIEDLNEMCRDEYGYSAGTRPGEKDPFTDYRENDGQPGFL